MVFKHDKLPFDHNDSIQLDFQHVRQLGYGGYPTSFVNGHISEEQQFADGAKSEINPESEDMTAVASDGNSNVAIHNLSAKLSSAGGDGGTLRSESSKRPFGVGEDLQVATKRTRQTDRNCPSPVHMAWQGSLPTSITVRDEFLSRDDSDAFDAAEDSHGSNFSSKGTQLEKLPVRPSSFFPGYYEDHHRPVRYSLAEESSPRSPVFNYLTRKLVALGPDHQAEVPVWRSRSSKKSDGPDAPTSVAGVLIDNGDDSDKWIGHCVMPMPESDPLRLEEEEAVGRRKADCCCCLDEGSIRCVRQHVMEAREQLMMNLGHERFTEFGLCEMGEDVALGWTEEEEQLFHKVVMSNPASLGKNFWDDLPRAFPSRSSKELVCYYYNVFMLQKRAEQNRFDPFNVDSDNDEWQESDGGELGTIDVDEDDDSGVESPVVAAHDISLHRDGESNTHKDEGNDDDDDDDEDALSNGFNDDADKLKFGFTATHDADATLLGGESTGEDQDVHDDSCTSYEGQHNGAESSADHADVFECLRNGNHSVEHRNNGMSSATDEGFALGRCDLKPWEVSPNGYVRGFETGHCDSSRPWDIGSISYFQGFEKDMDLLPTCNVIEEVFGSESWEKNREGHGVS